MFTLFLFFRSKKEEEKLPQKQLNLLFAYNRVMTPYYKAALTKKIEKLVKKI